MRSSPIEKWISHISHCNTFCHLMVIHSQSHILQVTSRITANMIIFIHVCSPEHTSKICTAHPCNLCHPAHRDLVCRGHMALGVQRCTSGVLLSTKLASTQLTGSAPTLYFWVGRNFWQKLTKAWNLPFIIMRLMVHFYSIGGSLNCAFVGVLTTPLE